MKTLKNNERCPIHGKYDCCGRKPFGKRERFPRRGDVEKFETTAHPRGYIEICSRRELRKRLLKKIEAQEGRCAPKEKGGCGLPLDDFRGVELDHIEPRSMGCEKDSHMDNLQALCATCNRQKGSNRF